MVILQMREVSREGFLREAVSNQICWLREDGLHVAQGTMGEPLDSWGSKRPAGGALYYGSINDVKSFIKNISNSQYNALIGVKIFCIPHSRQQTPISSINCYRLKKLREIVISLSNSVSFRICCLPLAKAVGTTLIGLRMDFGIRRQLLYKTKCFL